MGSKRRRSASSPAVNTSPKAEVETPTTSPPKSGKAVEIKPDQMKDSTNVAI
jgi:hypothetical protein